MNVVQTLQTISTQLRSLFEEKSELKGFEEWNQFIGCVCALDAIVEFLVSSGDSVEGKAKEVNTAKSK